MIYKERRIVLGDNELLLRSAKENDAEMLCDYIKTVTGETRFLMCEPDEIGLSIEEELDFIKSHNESPDGMLIMGFLVKEEEGRRIEEFVGNCSFTRISGSRRYQHRAGIGIALFQKYTGLGIGRLMLSALLEEIKSLGYEQAELTVISNNDRARHLYESFGFVEYGRLPDANKYDDGTYSDDINMVLKF
ncbi:Protein N-acetyltransferase, RimJ/RimL family [Lachnospiraceae bacterium]|nr:Protein N-acetyltransferase, RimJ/RimL family [Lachnospiraceae bacterium]